MYRYRVLLSLPTKIYLTILLMEAEKRYLKNHKSPNSE